jgi:hypothetical protein
MPAGSDLHEIELLLKRLNGWQRESGLPVLATSDVRSTGESILESSSFAVDLGTGKP